MDLSAAIQLMQVTRPPRPFMRVADVLLNFEEAQSATEFMFQTIQDFYNWDWPSADRHLANRRIIPDDKDDKRRQRDPDEDDEEYNGRMRRVEAWPGVEADKHCQWIQCAMITARALDYLQQAQDAGQSLSGKLGEYRYHFDPLRFYDFMWICLHQGHSWRSWKTDPEKPSESELNAGAWYRTRSANIIQTVVEEWHRGAKLEDLVPVTTLRDLAGADGIRARFGLDGKPLREGVIPLEDLVRRNITEA